VTEVSGGAAIHAGSVAEIANAMRGIAANPGVRADLGAKGLARAAAFSWKCTARRTHELYQRIAAGGRQ
jgi:glycosyltransferase involved in cell wall biosynthesis